MKIVNRIVTSLLAIAVFPFLIFQLFFKIVLSVSEESLAYTLINSFAGENNMLTGNRLGIQESLWNIFKGALDKTDNAMNFDIVEIWNSLPEELSASKIMIIASLILIVLGAILAIVIVGCSIFTKAYKTIIALGLGGFAFFLSGIVLFGKAGEPLTNGDVDVLGLLSGFMTSGETGGLGSVITGFLEGTINVDTFAMGGAVFGAMIMMLAVAVWEFAYYITLPENERPAKKIKKAKEKKA